MIQKADIIKMAKHVFKRGRGVPDKKLRHPGREWAIGLLVFVAMLFAGGFVSVNLFEKYNNLHEVDVAMDTVVTRYNATLVETVLKKYNDRGATYVANEDISDETDEDAQEDSSASSIQESDLEEVQEEQSASSTEEVIDETPETESDSEEETDTNEEGDEEVIILEN